MRLEQICQEVASKVLSEPGTMVQCMKNCCGLVVGSFHIVGERVVGNGPFLYIAEAGDSWLANRFRRVLS